MDLLHVSSAVCKVLLCDYHTGKDLPCFVSERNVLVEFF